MSANLDFWQIAARKKLGRGDDWLVFRWEVVGHTNDLLITGGVPIGFFQRGPRKGKPRWQLPGEQCVVTDTEVRAERVGYEARTGNCSKCQGSGREWAGWSKSEGSRFKPCADCAATGRVKP